MKLALRELPEPPAADFVTLLGERRDGATTTREERVRENLLMRALGEPTRYVLGGGKRFRAELVTVAFQLAGGRGEAPPFLAQLIELLHAGSLVIDDIEDGSTRRRGAPALHVAVGLPLALNTGNFLYFWPLEQVAELGLAPSFELAIYREYARTMGRAHRGQALDLGVRLSELPQADVPAVATAIAELKTGALMSFAARLGALAAHAGRAQVDALGEFGERLGVGLQRLDDLGSMSSERMRDKGLEDLRMDRVTHAWSFLSRRLDRYAYKRLTHRVRSDGPEALGGLLDDLGSALREHDAHGEARSELRDVLTILDGQLHLPRAAQLRVAAELERLEAAYV